MTSTESASLIRVYTFQSDVSYNSCTWASHQTVAHPSLTQTLSCCHRFHGASCPTFVKYHLHAFSSQPLCSSAIFVGPHPE
ncbi:hypothetical protein HanIR_Chr10g0485521 [Helianthus annuus]|nr:hypothetical protein HanIR_Chr10g0485521 [Helianthus annuus]